MIVLGGGILGVCHLFEAVRRGLHALLIERDDFGGATSWSSQRIVHGGLRYLQSADLARHRASVRERTWLLKHFPDQVRPMQCLMPLYDRGMKRRSVMRAALRAHDLLSRHHNDELPPEQMIPDSRVIAADEVVRRFPGVEQTGLRGGAVWSDAMLLTPQRVLMEWLRWSCAAGATALNYVEAIGLITSGGRARAVRAIDHCDGSEHAFSSAKVINTTGPWISDVDRSLTGVASAPVPQSLALCLLLDRPPVSDAAVAVSPTQSGSPMLFLTPCKGRLLAGTAHLPWTEHSSSPPSPELSHDDPSIRTLLDHLNMSVPGFDASVHDVARVFAGLLPARRVNDAEPSHRTRWIDHETLDGPAGLLSVTGIKYTTARAVAERTMHLAFPDRSAHLPERPPPFDGLDTADGASLSATVEPMLRTKIHQLADEESVMSVDDLLFRRTDWGADARTADGIRATLSAMLDAGALKPFRRHCTGHPSVQS